MLIKFCDKEYSPVKKLTSSNKSDVYICRQTNPKSQKLFTVNIIKDSNLIKELLPIFMAFKAQNSVHDPIDLFCMDSKLYVIFNYYQGNALYHPDIIILSLKEKIELAKKLLLFVKSQKIPLAILNLILEKDNLLIINDSNDLSFNYFLNLNEFSSSPHTSDIIKKIGVILKEAIFHDYLLCHPGIHDIIKNCEHQHYKSLEDLNHEFDSILNYSKDIPEANSKNVLGYIKTTCFIIACVFFVFYLVLNIPKKFEPKFNPKDSYSGIVNTIKLIHQNDKENNDSTKITIP